MKSGGLNLTSSNSNDVYDDLIFCVMNVILFQSLTMHFPLFVSHEKC